ncbi:BhlA/UviB family holin-like peptide [Clostridium sp. DJ247]|uniref:BhlA/UviB family holin-like peptide n=1 Tax=Clostridium sp. DJ247 TaxID=2726188 RepID=UPI00162A21FA|nr:BhlA/UviB family holin-like peptide [Clostridium sp. DJ247]MBC2580599.1 bacteriocin [Clostridium sp. DJ247]
MNESEALKLVATQGVFALLFCYLLFYVLKENSKRESNYQNIIKDLTNLLPSIKQDVEEIKNKIFK